MTLRGKTLLVMTLTLVALILLLYFVLRNVMITSYSRLENQSAQVDLDRVVNSLQDSAEDMALGMQDWSNWDATYQFVQDLNPAYIDENLGDDTFSALNINLMLFVDSSNHIVYTKVVDPFDIGKDNFAPEFADLERDGGLASVIDAPAAGYFVLDGEPLLIASHPILPSAGSGIPVGTLIWGRHLDASTISRYSERLRLALGLWVVNQAGNPADIRTAQARLAPDSRQVLSALNEDTLGSYALLNDIFGTPSLILRVMVPRLIYQQGQASLTYFLLILVVAGGVFGLAALLLLERLVLTPMAALSGRVAGIGANDDFTSRLPITGHDELTQLARSINAMLDNVTQSRAALRQLNGELESRVIQRTTELEQQKTQLQRIMDTMGEGLVLSVEGTITYANRACAELLDYSPNELVGKPFALLHTDADWKDTPVARTPLQHYETRFSRRDGSPVSVAITSTVVDETDSRPRRVVIVRDITQELAAKAQKDYFFARASHDLRTPLTNIMTRLYLLGKKPEELDRHLRILDQVSMQMMTLVNDLLDMMRFEQGKLVLHRHDLVLQELCEQVVETQQADAEVRGIDLSAEMDAAPLHIYADSSRLQQAITNLVGNAIHYTPEGGRIIVRVEQQHEGRQDYAVIQVRDNGVGISPENLAHIFDPFFRVNDEKSDGSGLGLSIVKEIVELHEGKVAVSSIVGVGTTFTLRFALDLNQQPHAADEVTDQALVG